MKQERIIGKGELGVVLLVEPEDYIGELLGAILSMEGYTVVRSDSVPQALAFAETNPGKIDILVTELVMHPIGGYAIAKAIEAKHPQAAVLFYTGMHESGLKEWSRGEPYLMKPFTPRVLVDRMKAAIAEKRA